MYEKVVSHYLEKLNELLARPKHRFSKISSADVPKEGGIYAIYDSKFKTIIYVGRSGNSRRRLLGNHKSGDVTGSQFRKALGRHFNLESEVKITRHILNNCSFQYMTVKEFEELVKLEHFTTAILAPVLNVQLKQ